MLKYTNDVLVLTAIRHNSTGRYHLYPEMVEHAKRFDIPCTEVLAGGGTGGMDALKAMKQLEGVEGFVIRFDDGAMYKVKTEWYFANHKKDKSEVSFNAEGTVWKCTLFFF